MGTFSDAVMMNFSDAVMKTHSEDLKIFQAVSIFQLLRGNTKGISNQYPNSQCYAGLYVSKSSTMQSLIASPNYL